LKRLHADWCRWRALQGWEQRLLFIAACWYLPQAGLCLHTLGLQRSLARLERCPLTVAAALPTGFDAATFAQRCAELLALAARRGGYRPSCLPQALALHALLRRRGLRTGLRIGVLPESQPLQAHAWVEFQGCALGDAGHAGFSAFEGIGAP
jgi:hypothetical protein